tara:strand:+ start:137 stop:811 length:675 start_codon:yes stop_codon:yes gene_type:complete
MRFLSLVAAFIILYTPILNAQDFNFDGDTMTVVFESNLDKKELHSAIFSAIANIYNSANDVVQMNDTGAGKIIIKGMYNIKISNFQNEAMYSKEIIAMTPEYLNIDVEHTISAYIKDNKYKIQLVTGEKFSKHLGQRYPLGTSYLKFDYPSISEIEKLKQLHIQVLSQLKNGEEILQRKETIAYLDAMENNQRTNATELRDGAKSLALNINSGVINEIKQNDDW